jgi:glyoxylase-like metal-dependent hydrolase (beta-lactamase superfamily II)
MKMGDFNLRLISDGEIWVDGGTMFGATPKAVWRRQVKCDRRNRIRLSLNCLLIETPRKRILVDAGMGTEAAPEVRKMHSPRGIRGMRRRIQDAGLKVGDIDIVIFSHLHYDHVDGALEMAGGKIAPVFPKAEYVVQAGEWRDAFNPNEFTAGGYNERGLKALERTGRLRLIEGDVKVCPGVSAMVTGGHTARHQIVLLESRGRKAAFVADIIPMAAHLTPDHIAALDVDPLETLEFKRRFLRQAEEEEILCFFGHERERPAGYVRRGGDGYFLEAARDK